MSLYDRHVLPSRNMQHDARAVRAAGASDAVMRGAVGVGSAAALRSALTCCAQAMRRCALWSAAVDRRAPRQAHQAASRGRLILVWLLASLLTAPALAAEQVAYQWRSVAIGGGGFVSGVLFHPAQKGLRYARTDVGGAYRWDEASARWVALTDWLGPDDENLMGIDAFAIDPRDPRALYLAAGTYLSERAGNAAILRSHDQGRSFMRTDLPFKLGGNEQGRGNGERLAVDPNDGQVLLLGSRDAGLWRSDDRGAHWQAVTSFPAVATSASASAANHAGRRQQVGFAFVLFDPASGTDGHASQRIYAGVSTQEHSLFVSNDAGLSWQPVPGQPTGLRPSHMVRSSTGIYYLSYGDAPGPDLMANGALWKFEPTAARWTDISPAPQPQTGPGFGWGAVAVDPRQPQTLIASTFRRYKPGEDIYRSTDGGKSWAPLFPRSQFEHDAAPWTAQAHPHWMASLAIDPFDSDRAMFVTGYGIWTSRDLTGFEAGQTVHWWFNDAGLEETVALDLLSPSTGAHLLSALGDIDGFRHDDLDAPTLQFQGPRLTNGEHLANAGQRPQFVVRSGTVRERLHDEVRIVFSRDAGAHWQAMASEPPGGGSAGQVAVTADASRVLWQPRDGDAWFSDDLGQHWQRVEGLPRDAVLAADRDDAKQVLAFNQADRQLRRSHDGGAHFQVIAQLKPDGGRAAAELVADPAHTGRAWLAAGAQGLQYWDGQSFKPLAEVQAASSVGVGKPMSEGGPLTLFLAGRVQGVDGLFRSADGGAHWLRINDQVHRFGKIYHVTGDPRIAGRIYFAPSGRGVVYGDPR